MGMVEKKITNPNLFYTNQYARNTRIFPIIEGMDTGIVILPVIASTFALSSGITTYIMQSDDEDPKTPDKIFERTRDNLETILRQTTRV